MKKIVYIMILMAGSFSQANTLPTRNGKYDVAGVGEVRVRHEVVGEPIGQPERVEVFVTCAKTKKQFRLGIFRMCIFEGHSLEEGTKTLTLTMFYGRVVPQTGDVICDRHDMKNIELIDVCAAGKP